jgi:hypothetical protein
MVVPISHNKFVISHLEYLINRTPQTVSPSSFPFSSLFRILQRCLPFFSPQFPSSLFLHMRHMRQICPQPISISSKPSQTTVSSPSLATVNHTFHENVPPSVNSFNLMLPRGVTVSLSFSLPPHACTSPFLVILMIQTMFETSWEGE